MSETNERMAYRLVRDGEPIKKGDQPLRDDCITWGELSGWEAGMTYNARVLAPMRRPTKMVDGIKAHLYLLGYLVGALIPIGIILVSALAVKWYGNLWAAAAIGFMCREALLRVQRWAETRP